MTNPYEAPPTDFVADPKQKDVTLPPAQDPGLVSHVRVVAILMMVQGTLEIVMGLFWAAMTVMFPSLQSIMEEQQGPAAAPDVAVWFIIGIYGGIGLIHVVAGTLHIYAGYRNYSFRRRTFGIVALSAGMITVMGCYCMPTAVALSVYGLVVYLNSSVARAFAMGEQGLPGDAILVTFSRYRASLPDPVSNPQSPPPDSPFQGPTA